MLDEKLIAELKDKHGQELVAIEVAGSTLVFRKPKRQEYDRWSDKKNEQGKGVEAARELATSTLVYPNADALRTALDAQPAALMCMDGILDQVTGLAGLGGPVTAKKL